MQGVYTMSVGGCSRVIAGCTAGLAIMNGNLKNGLFMGAALAFIGFLVITILFGRIPPRSEQQISESE